MEFFNKKEEVLEVTLTQKGKELFSSGSFKPSFYSFYDTDIIYESQFIEEQNEIVPRIKSTPTLKQNSSNYQNSKNTLTVLETQKLYCELGNKELSDQFKPAWQLNFIKSPSFQYVGDRNNPTVTKMYQVKSSSSFDNNNSNQEMIPQIDIQTIYGISKLSGTLDHYLIKDDPIIVGVSEFNSFGEYEKQEFEIEVYVIQDYYQMKSLSFNSDMKDSVSKYVTILTDNLANFEEAVLTKDIYGDLVEKDDSNC